MAGDLGRLASGRRCIHLPGRARRDRCERARSRGEVVVAPGIEREADEIARRILEEVAAGRRFREIGIILRSPEVYLALLRTTLERFGIPARFYFDSVSTEQPAIRYLTGTVDAMLGGWDHKQTLTAMKLAPGVGASAPMDRFDFDIREKLPGAGLDPLCQIIEGVSHFVYLADRASLGEHQ